jgi:hypothetical protein
MRWTVLVAGIMGLATVGCVQMPTEKQEVVDLRPQLSFVLADSSDDASRYRIFVDGLAMGTAGSFLSGKNGLRVLSGTHEVRVEHQGRVVVSERLYLGDGAIRNILIPRP